MLRELKLHLIDFSWTWLSGMSTALPALTQLVLSDAYFGTEVLPPLQALKTLR